MSDISVLASRNEADKVLRDFKATWDKFHADNGEYYLKMYEGRYHIVYECSSWDDFLKNVLAPLTGNDISRQHFYYMVRVGEVRRNLQIAGIEESIPALIAEPLAGLPVEKQIAAYKEAVEVAPHATYKGMESYENGMMTPGLVTRIAQRMKDELKPQPAPRSNPLPAALAPSPAPIQPPPVAQKVFLKPPAVVTTSREVGTVEAEYQEGSCAISGKFVTVRGNCDGVLFEMDIPYLEVHAVLNQF